jgi:AcrR family transcriptional regulator
MNVALQFTEQHTVAKDTTSSFKRKPVDKMPSPGNEKENPRTTRVRHVILEAAVDLLIEKGAGEVTATRIAEATGVARTTIYRHWPDQAGLLLSTVQTLMVSHRKPPSDGDVRENLRDALLSLEVRLCTKEVRPVFAALVELASRDASFASSQQTFVSGLVAQVTAVLEQAKLDDEIPADVDCDVATTMVAGPLLHQFLVMRQDIGEDLIDQTITQFMNSLSTN